MALSPRRLLRALGVAALVLLAVALCFAQQAAVTRNTNLRPDPSSTGTPIRLLTPPEKVDLIESAKTSGYYHVRTKDGQEGWVWGRNVRVGPGSMTPTSGTPTTGGGPTTPATAISPDWEKPNPVSTDFQAEDGTCGPAGNDKDTATNLRKNRTDVPGGYHEVPFDAIATLPYPRPAPTNRLNWSSQQLAQIEPYEGVAVSVVGYVVAVKNEKSGESTNCNWTKDSEVDWHIELVKQAGRGEADAIVVETTPRVRTSHPKWIRPAFAPVLRRNVPVRISGWLMFDPDHPGHLGRYRTTLWEVHPITKIEFSTNGRWVDLDKEP